MTFKFMHSDFEGACKRLSGYIVGIPIVMLIVYIIAVIANNFNV